MNYHQTPEEIIKSATPAQRIIWNDIFLRFGERVSIQQYQFYGAYTEFITYSARKIYFGYLVRNMFNAAGGASALIAGTNQYYDENDNIIGNLTNEIEYFNVTAAAARWRYNTVTIENILFSRIVSDYPAIYFVGYKIGK